MFAHLLHLLRTRKPADRRPGFRRFHTKSGRRPFRPILEGLENRWLLNAVTWTGSGGDDNFDNPDNWQDAVTREHRVPGPGDDATISVTFSQITVLVPGSEEVGTIVSVPKMHITGGTFTIDGLGTDSSLNGLVLDEGAALQVKDRRLTLTSGGNIFGALDAEGTGNITFRNGTFDVSDTAAFAGPGQYYENGAVVAVLADLAAPLNWWQDGGTLAVAPGHTFTVGGSANTFLWTDGTLSGPGTIDVQGDATLSLGGAAAKSLDGGATLINEGTGSWTGAGDLRIQGGSMFQNAGTFTLSNSTDAPVAFGVINNTGTWIQNSVADSVVTHMRSVFNNISPGIVQLNQGILSLEVGGNSTGTFDAAVGTQLVFAGGTYTLNDGSTLTSDGLVRVTGGQTTLVVDGTVSVMNLDVVNSYLRVGSNGVLNVADVFELQANAELDIDLGGTDPGAGYGQVNVAGTANLAGTLVVRFVNHFLPRVGDGFTILTFGALNGRFARVNLSQAGLPPGEHWDDNGYADGSFTLMVDPN